MLLLFMLYIEYLFIFCIKRSDHKILRDYKYNFKYLIFKIRKLTYFSYIYIYTLWIRKNLHISVKPPEVHIGYSTPQPSDSSMAIAVR